MKILLLFCVSVAFVSAQYSLDWEIEQNENDFGAIYYDLNEDGVKELGKFWFNTVTFFEVQTNSTQYGNLKVQILNI